MGIYRYLPVFTGFISGELIRKQFVERKCAVISPSDRIDCGYEGKPKNSKI